MEARSWSGDGTRRAGVYGLIVHGIRCRIYPINIRWQRYTTVPLKNGLDRLRATNFQQTQTIVPEFAESSGELPIRECDVIACTNPFSGFTHDLPRRSTKRRSKKNLYLTGWPCQRFQLAVDSRPDHA